MSNEITEKLKDKHRVEAEMNNISKTITNSLNRNLPKEIADENAAK